MIRYTIKLTRPEVEELRSIINKGSHTSQTFRTAYILLNCDKGKYSEKVTNEQLSKVLKIGMRTIDRVKKNSLRKVWRRHWKEDQQPAYMKEKLMGMWKQN